MAQTNPLKKYLDAGMSFTALTQTKAEALVKDLVKTGEVQTEQAQAVVSDLLERSRKNTEALIDQIRKEIASSAESLGLATIADVTRLEKLIASIRSGGAAPKAAPAAPAPVKKAAAKKAPAKKAAAKKAPAKKAAAKKAPAKKAAAKKAPAKKAAAKKAAAKKAPAKKAAAKRTAS
jgi:polyhydroxyalkanoate synthesis regulator phasin